MASVVKYEIDFAGCVDHHMTFLTARQRATILDAIERHLIHQPLVKTRNRKPLDPNDLAPWELRVGGLRAFYEMSESRPDVVLVLAVGVKVRERLYIAGEEFPL